MQNITGVQALIASLLGLVALGGIKALVGLRKSRVARMGLGGKSKGQNKKKDKNGQIIIVEYNENGDEINAENVSTKTPSMAGGVKLTFAQVHSNSSTGRRNVRNTYS